MQLVDSTSLGPVLLVSPWYPPTIGGVADVTDRLRRLLSGAHVETYVWVCEDQTSCRSNVDCEPQNLQRVRIPDYVFYELNFRTVAAMLMRAPAALFRTLHFVRRHRIRTVILQYPIGYAWPFLLLRWLNQIRLIASCHGNEILKFGASSRLARWLFRNVLRYCDAIIVPAAHLPESVRKMISGRTLPIWLIPNCIDVEFFMPRPNNIAKTHRPTLIHVSSFTPRKRTLDIVTAFSLAKLPSNSRLVMVGVGPDLEAAKALAVTLNVASRVEFVGAPKDIRPFLWQADLLVTASDEESGPLTLLEGMACEVPWIATPWGVAVMLAPEECGLVVPNRSPQAMATAMESLINHPERLRAMRGRCRPRAVKDFPESKYVERYIDLITAVERGKGSRPIDYSSYIVGNPSNAEG